MKKKIEGRQDLIKNEDTGVFSYINTDAAKQARLKRKKALKIEQQRAKEVDDLKKEVSEIKDMLKTLMEKL